MTDIEIELDDPHRMMLEDVVEVVGEEAVHSELHGHLVDALRRLYDNRDQLEEK